MPVFYQGHQVNPRKWDKCLETVKATMLANGWEPLSYKFRQVQLKKTRKLYERS